MRDKTRRVEGGNTSVSEAEVVEAVFNRFRMVARMKEEEEEKKTAFVSWQSDYAEEEWGKGGGVA